MFYRSSPVAVSRRPGVVLLVVMAMLALFASLALSFVFYADSEALAANYSRSSLVKDTPDVDPEVLAGFFLSKFVYGDTNPYSAGLGWDLARSIYGYNPAALNFTPYNGTGRANGFAPKTPDPNPNIGVPMYNAINYQTFYTPGQATSVRAPEYYGSILLPAAAGPPTAIYNPAGAPATPTYRYAGGGNPPWTAYDIDNIWLAEMTADGTPILPSFGRPWNMQQAGVATQAGKYMSLFPDPVWNPAFFPLPDAPNGPTGGSPLLPSTPNPPQVKNYDNGPGGNDSYWMDWGYPIMTAPDGKRYKALFAPLVLDLSNRLHLWAHGNNLGSTSTTSAPGTSNQGFGPPEVSLNTLPTVRTPISAASEKGGTVTISTAPFPHGLTAAGQKVLIAGVNDAGVNAAGYDGTYPVTKIVNATSFHYTSATKGLTALPTPATPIANGYVYNMTPGSSPLLELQALFALRYGPGGQALPPVAPYLPPITRPGTWFSPITINGVDQTGAASPTNNMSAPQPYMSAPPVWMTSSVKSATSHTVTLSQISSTVPPPFAVPPALLAPPTPFPWALQVGMSVTVQDPVPANVEQVTVTAVDYATSPPSFTAIFAKKHTATVAAPIQIMFGPPAPPPFFGYPAYPASWNNVAPANNPLAFNLVLPGAPTPPNLSPLPMSNQEALLRWGGTNSPALTSGIYQIMPNTFGATNAYQGMRARNMVTLQNWCFDRVPSAPYLNFNQNSPQTEYTYIGGMPYPVVGNNEIQNVVVTGTVGGTFQLLLPGQAKAAGPITISANTNKNKIKMKTTIQRDLKKILPAGGTAAVSAITVNNTVTPPTYSFTVFFGGTMSNQDVPQITGNGLAGAPLPTVAVATTKNGSNLFGAPNFAAIQVPTGDYTADWRSSLSQRLRVDLTRPLTEYPAPVAATGLINTASVQYQRAVADRQQFARDLYNALVRVTGARDPNLPANAGMQPTAPDYQGARWLAQLAVNIVDYIDDDDYMTPFNWYGNEWLFGTELPRLVLNEAYVQMEPPPTPAAPGQVNVWAELHNPFKSYPAGTYAWSPLDNGTAVLQLTAAGSPTPPYKIEVYESNPALTAALQGVNNPTGGPPAGTAPMNQVTNWGAILTTMQVPPANRGKSGGAIVTLQVDPGPPAKGPFGATETAKGVVHITTTTAHGLTNADIGKAVTISGVPVVGYDGTFLITAIPSKTSFAYAPTTTGMAKSGSPPAPAPPATATYVRTDSVAGNNGFYVIGPQNALYSDPTRPPNLPATYVSPGMSFPSPAATIQTATNANNIITIQATAPLPPTFLTGELVTIQGVMTTNAMKMMVPAMGYNGLWIIQSVAGNTFTATALPGVTPGPFSQKVSGGGTATVVPIGVTLLLRRLANPHVAWNATTNPYITVDYIDGIPVNPQAPGNNFTFGRSQPYAASTSLVPQSGFPAYPPPPVPPPLNAPQNSFFTLNSNATAPFDWLVHLDRPPVNPIELLHVSGYRPHELTQQFVSPITGQKFGHYAPWNPFAPNAASPTLTAADPNSLIYRALDQMSTRYMAGLYTGGRFPGNININTITEYEVFQALCDAHDATAQYPNAWFTQNDVAWAFAKLILSRDGAQFVTGTTTQGSTTVSNLTPFPATGAGPTLPSQAAVGNLVSGSGIPFGTTVLAVNPPTGTPTTVTLSNPAFAGGTTLLLFVNPTNAAPFKSLSAAMTATPTPPATGGPSVSFNDTFFRPDFTSPNTPQPPLFTPYSAQNNPNAHPYWQASLLQKIYNNVTTTSNVFAVWWTVGFFEVVDESVRPARLGQEIGRSQNRHVRHRFFAIVDRSGLQLYKGTTAGAVTLAAGQAMPQSATVALNAGSLSSLSGPVAAWSATQIYGAGSIVTSGANTYYCTQNTQYAPAGAAPTNAAGAAYWQLALQPGMLLEIDAGNPMAEVVAVQSVNGLTFTANFANSHLAGAPIICRGNPGPRVTYNPNDDKGVVLHLSVIK